MAAVPGRLGVVVLNWNGREHLGACLDSLRDQDHPDCFVVVVDNASADGSLDFLAARPDIELAALDENLRFAGGNNVGAERAIERGAETLLILNNDTVVEPGALRALTASMMRDGYDLAGPRIVYSARPQQIWYGGGRFSAWTGYLAHRAIRRGIDDGADPAGRTDWVTGCALAISADLWQTLGGLDEAFYIYSEDVDLCLRARGRGARAGYCPSAVVRHAVSASVGGNASTFKAYHRTRARWQLMRRHGRGWFWPVGVFCTDLAWAGARLLRGQFAAAGAVFRAMFEGKSAPPAWRTEQLRQD